MGLRSYGAAVLSAATALWLMSGPQREKPLMSVPARGPVGVLEAYAAAHAGDPEAVRGLAQAYLDAQEPGLAVALIRGAPVGARDDVRVRHVFARALVDQGRSEEALGAEAGVLAACRPLADGQTAPRGCDPVLLASATRRAGILRELVALGVEDAQADPEQTRVAYQNATREARVMVQ